MNPIPTTIIPAIRTKIMTDNPDATAEDEPPIELVENPPNIVAIPATMPKAPNTCAPEPSSIRVVAHQRRPRNATRLPQKNVAPNKAINK